VGRDKEHWCDLEVPQSVDSKKRGKMCNKETVKKRNRGRIYHQMERQPLEEYRNYVPTAVLWKSEIYQSN